MHKVSPTIAEIDALRKTAGTEPVVMINLLKFRDQDGIAAYLRYMNACELANCSPRGKVIYSGGAGADIGDGEI